MRDVNTLRMKKNRYWNPFLETLPRDKLVNIQIKRFRETMAFAIKNCPMYREKFKKVGNNLPEDIKTLEDLEKSASYR